MIILYLHVRNSCKYIGRQAAATALPPTPAPQSVNQILHATWAAATLQQLLQQKQKAHLAFNSIRNTYSINLFNLLSTHKPTSLNHTVQIITVEINKPACNCPQLRFVNLFLTDICCHIIIYKLPTNNNNNNNNASLKLVST